MFVAVGIVTLLMMVVVPQFQTIFEQMLRGAPLPGPTQIVINISELFSTHPILVLGGMGGTVGGPAYRSTHTSQNKDGMG